MKKMFLGVFLAAFFSQAAYCEVDLATCYRKATNKSQYQDCLEREYKGLKDQYEKVLERTLTEAQTLDRVRTKKAVAKSFNDANKAFDKYVKEECGFLGSNSKSGVELACKINLLRVRMGSLQHTFLHTN